jgi:sugar/nucleoside kinase (ribokinase family)
MERAHLRQERVNVDAVATNPETGTGVAFIMSDADGENTILVVNGANDRLSAEAVSRALEC